MKAGSSAVMPRVTVRDIQSRIGVDARRARRIVRGVITAERAGSRGEITVCFLDDPAIRRLNRRFHRRDCATDVLAFDMAPAGRGFLADIVISTDTAAVNAAKYHTGPLYESYLYLIHGTLHILGYNDSSSRGRAVMRRKEAFYLKKMGIVPGNA